MNFLGLEVKLGEGTLTLIRVILASTSRTEKKKNQFSVLRTVFEVCTIREGWGRGSMAPVRTVLQLHLYKVLMLARWLQVEAQVCSSSIWEAEAGGSRSSSAAL